MTRTRVAADWAWISKDPQAGIGYGVLATSRGDVDFGPFVGRYVPGSPSSTAPPDAPDAPPWVTFGPFLTGSGEILITVSVRERSRERDHAGRPVWPQKLLVIRYAELAQAGASYQTVSRIALGTEIPAPERTTLPLEIGEQPASELTGIIEDYGFEQIAACAAAVLEGPVVVGGAGDLDRDQRLAVLDAVAALLPYGFRAELSVSSVVDNTSQHGIRLAFADFVNDGQRLLPLRASPPGPRTDLGGRYLDMLGKKKSTPGLDALIRHLWEHKEPCTFGKPGQALDILADLDFYDAFRREAGKGPVPLIMLGKFLAEPAAAQRAWTGFDTQTRNNALASYLPGCNAEAAAAVVPCWSFLGDDVVRLINRGLDGGSLDWALWCLQTAGPVEDRLLGDLLVPGQKVGPQRAAILIELLRRRDVPQPDEYRYTCNQLRYDEAVDWQACLVRDLLIRELATEPEKAWAWVRWLCESEFTAKWPRPDWVAALDFVAFDPPPGQAVASARSLILGDVRWAVVLLRLARQSRCLRDLLDQADQQLIGLAARMPVPLEPGSTGAQLRAELDRNLWPLDVRPGAVASIDVARVLLGGEPGNFPGELPQDVLDGYFDGLGSALALEATWSRLAEVENRFLRRAVPREAPGELTAGGVRLLNAWATDARLMPGLLDYIANLEPEAYPYHPGLSGAFWNILRQHPALAGYAAGNQLIIAVRGALRDPRAAFRRALAEDAVMNTVLGRACFNARCAGLSVEGVIRALARAGAAEIGAGRLDDVLREFQALRYRDHLDMPLAQRAAGQNPTDASEDELFECYRLITGGALGGSFAEEFTTHLENRLREEILVREWVLRNILPAARKRERRDDPARGKFSRLWPRLRRPWRRGDRVASRP